MLDLTHLPCPICSSPPYEECECFEGDNLSLSEYQLYATSSAVYPDRGKNVTYPILGVCGEAGELAEKWKKCLRDNNGILSDDVKSAMVKELGDVLWYVATVASELRVTLSSVAQGNIKKLLDREERGTLQGSGDER